MINRIIQRFKIQNVIILEGLPQLADILTVLTVSVGAGVRVCGGGEGGNSGVGIISAGSSPTSQVEDTADSKA